MIEQKMFGFMYESALRDATLQRAFEGEKKHLSKNQEAQELVRAFTLDLLNGRIANEVFDKRFKELLQEVENSFKRYLGNEQFTFGNAQKLVNMTIKYVYLTTYQQPDRRKYFTKCHCPMDSIIKAKVWKELKNQEPLQNAELENRRQELIAKIKMNKKEYDMGWSKVLSTNKLQYELFQNAVCFLAELHGLTALEYDYVFWQD